MSKNILRGAILAAALVRGAGARAATTEPGVVSPL